MPSHATPDLSFHEVLLDLVMCMQDGTSTTRLSEV